MVGGLVQLAAYGSEDLYLTGNPQITFFKMVYRRHTNFAMENIEQQFEGAGGNLEFSRDNIPRTLRCKIPKDGDLISNMYFAMRVPNIFSYYDISSDVYYYFYWSKFLALNMIKSIHINIGSQEIDLHYSEWLHVYNELYNTAEQKKVFYRLIGHTEDMYNPTNSAGNYPESLTTGASQPSIIERTLYIPLSFWFNTRPGLALPLVALDDKTSSVELKITLNTIDQFYILEYYDKTGNIRYKLKPDLTDPRHNILNYLVGDDSNQVGWGLNPHIEINYIFLDKRERELFARIEHDYLMEQVIRREFLNINQVEFTTTLRNLYHPVKYIVIVLKRSDSVSRNDHNNYSNWFDDSLDPLMGTTQYSNWYDSTSISSNPVLQQPTITRDNYNSYKRDIIVEALFKINGMDRIKEKSGTYFNLVQKYQHNLESDDTGIYVYSFSLDPTKPEPSGSCNMSRIDTLDFKFKFLKLPTGNEYTYEMNMYFVNYNIFRVMGGVASLVFQSVS